MIAPRFTEYDEFDWGDTVDVVKAPPWYTRGGIETKDFLRAHSTLDEYLGYCRLSALVYLDRAGLKREHVRESKDEAILRDVRKAREFIGFIEEALLEEVNGQAKP